MAIRPIDNYAQQANGITSDYPHGSARNVSTPAADDGTPLEAAWVQDMAGWHQSLLAEAGLTNSDISGIPEEVGNSDYLKALKRIIAEHLGVKGVITGLEVENNPSAPTAEARFKPGRGIANNIPNEMIVHTTLLNKFLNEAWAPGNNAGGNFDPSIILDETIHFMVIKNTTTGAVDAGFTHNLDGSTLPAGYDAFIRVASMQLNSALFYEFTQYGDYFYFKDRLTILFSNNHSSGTGTITLNSRAPVDIRARALCYFTVNTTGTAHFTGVFYNDEQGRPKLNDTNAFDYSLGGRGGIALNLEQQLTESNVFKLGYFNQSTENTFRMHQYGWVDTKRRRG